MHYTIQPGDTITDVTRRLHIDWETLRTTNPNAVGRSSRTGKAIIKAGVTVTAPASFKEVFAKETATFAPPQATSAVAPTPASKVAADGETIHVLKKGDTVWALAAKKYHVDPQAILRLNNITNPKTLQIGQQLRIPAVDTKSDSATEVVASWYGQYHHGKTMANGKPFDMYGLTIAHRDMPLGTRVELENPATGEKARATVTDRGPYVNGRDVDLSYRLAHQLSLARQGVGNLKMRVL